MSKPINLSRFDFPGNMPFRWRAPNPVVDEIRDQFRRADVWLARYPASQRLGRLRRLVNKLGAGAPIKSAIRPVNRDGIRGEWVIAPGADFNRRILYIHGGAFVVCSPASHRPLTSRISEITGAAVFAIDYRLIPEHKRMDGIIDCRRAYKWVQDNDPDGRQGVDEFFVMGDSAGGNLTLMLLAWARDEGLKPADAAVALSPITDSTFSSPSLVSNSATDFILGKYVGLLAKMPPYLRRAYSVGQNRMPSTDPRVSPLLGYLGNLPPTLIHASEAEVLVDDARRYANKARMAGSKVTLQTWPHMPHVWHAYFDYLEEAEEAMGQIAQYIKGIVQPSDEETEDAQASLAQTNQGAA